MSLASFLPQDKVPSLPPSPSPRHPASQVRTHAAGQSLAPALGPHPNTICSISPAGELSGGRGQDTVVGDTCALAGPAGWWPWVGV